MEHYSKGNGLLDQSKLSSGGVEFFYSIKPVFIEKVMNEIAEMDNGKEENKDIA